MTKPNSKLKCEVCKLQRNHVVYHTGQYMCRSCICKLPTTRLQDSVMYYYDVIYKRRKKCR